MGGTSLFALFLAITGLIYIQFLRGRKRNLKKIKKCASVLEEVFSPLDKTYTWVGGVAGFKAEYRLKKGDRLYVTFLLLPRQSLLYYPFSKMVFRADRLYLYFEFADSRNFDGAGALPFRKNAMDLKFVRKLEWEDGGRKVSVFLWYDDKVLKQILVSLWSWLEELK